MSAASIEAAGKAHVGRLIGAKANLANAKEWLFNLDMSDETIAGIAMLVDAQIEIALLQGSAVADAKPSDERSAQAAAAIDLKAEAKTMSDAAHEIAASLWRLAGLAGNDIAQAAFAGCLTDLHNLGEKIEAALQLVKHSASANPEGVNDGRT